MSILAAGCSTTQTPLEAEEQTPVNKQASAQVETHALDQEQLISSVANPEQLDPWQLVEQSMGKSPTESNALLLTASELFLGQQHYSTAYTMLEEINSAWLDSEQKIYFALIRARYALLRGDTLRAQSLLAQVPRDGTMQLDNQARFLQLDIAIAAQELDFRRAVIARIKLDSLLDNQVRLANQQRILNTLTRELNVFSAQDPAMQNLEFQGWWVLANLKRAKRFDEVELAAWRQQFPDHPALEQALANSLRTETVSSQHISLLLPLSSKLGRAAEAFRAGFDAAVLRDGRFDQSQVYDIGNEPDLIGFYYQSAVNDGADFIVGPLGRTGAQSLLAYLGDNGKPGVSTLLLGELGAEQKYIRNLWGLSLSPEQDAAAIAERAISEGYRSAAVLQRNNAWGERLSQAFRTAYESKGGNIVTLQTFEPERKDHSNEIKNMLEIGSSKQRHLNIQNLVGTKLKFSERRRNDIDFIFLAGNTRDARRIVPLAKFYRAHDLPIYASSSVFNGQYNKLTDEDLKDLQFADLPWLLSRQIEMQEREIIRIKQEQEAAEAAEELAKTQALAQAAGLPTMQPVPEIVLSTSLEKQAPLPPGIENRSGTGLEPGPEPVFEELPYSSATLNRLYALGVSAFEAIPQLNYLQSDEWYQFDTHTMSLNMDEHRNLRHAVAWGKYAASGITITP